MEFWWAVRDVCERDVFEQVLRSIERWRSRCAISLRSCCSCSLIDENTSCSSRWSSRILAWRDVKSTSSVLFWCCVALVSRGGVLLWLFSCRVTVVLSDGDAAGDEEVSAREEVHHSVVQEHQSGVVNEGLCNLCISWAFQSFCCWVWWWFPAPHGNFLLYCWYQTVELVVKPLLIMF